MNTSKTVPAHPSETTTGAVILDTRSWYPNEINACVRRAIRGWDEDTPDRIPVGQDRGTVWVSPSGEVGATRPSTGFAWKVEVVGTDDGDPEIVTVVRSGSRDES